MIQYKVPLLAGLFLHPSFHLKNCNLQTMSQYFKIGKLAASFGWQGVLVLQHSLGNQTSLQGLQAIYIEAQKDNFIPYFIESATLKSDTEVYLKLEGIDTMEAARKLTPKAVWLAQPDFQQHSQPSAPIALLGYTMVEGQQTLGEIIEVHEQPHQILCTIMYKGNEALIPLHEASLLKIDKKGKKVFVQLPEGLLDLYENA